MPRSTEYGPRLESCHATAVLNLESTVYFEYNLRIVQLYAFATTLRYMQYSTSMYIMYIRYIKYSRLHTTVSGTFEIMKLHTSLLQYGRTGTRITSLR